MRAFLFIIHHSSFIILLALCLSVASALAAADNASAKPEKLWVFLGTYTGKTSKGIYRCQLDLATGKLSTPELAAETKNPSFLAIHPNHHFLYAVGEFGDRQSTGAVSAFSLDPKTGALTFLNQQSSGGSGPCFVAVDAAGKNALVANYGSGSVASLPIGEDGKLGPATAFVQHVGSSVIKNRQEGPHAHSINLDKANRFAFAADLGCDKVFVYRFDPAKGTLTPNDPPAAVLEPGSGPRHFAFHPSGKFAYVIDEIAMTLTAYNYDAEHGVLETRQTISTLPKGATGKDFSTAEVVVHPSGKFVYGSNRGHHSIVVYAVDPETGALRYVENRGDDIKTPRNFAIDPTGKFLIVANQDSDSLVVFAIDPETGKLTPTGSKVPVGKPVCVRMTSVE